MNCHSPEACAREYAIGLYALSTIGRSASSVGIPRRSSASTMWKRYFRLRSTKIRSCSGRCAYQACRWTTTGLTRSGIAKPARMRIQRSSGVASAGGFGPRSLMSRTSTPAVLSTGSIPSRGEAGAWRVKAGSS